MTQTSDPLRVEMFGHRPKKITQHAAAEALGVHRVLLNAFLAGRRPWPEGLRERLVEYIRQH